MKRRRSVFGSRLSIGVQYRGASANDPVTEADVRRGAANLKPTRLALEKLTAKHLEGFLEERTDVVGLELASLGAIHLVAKFANARSAQ